MFRTLSAMIDEEMTKYAECAARMPKWLARWQRAAAQFLKLLNGRSKVIPTNRRDSFKSCQGGYMNAYRAEKDGRVDGVGAVSIDNLIRMLVEH